MSGILMVEGTARTWLLSTPQPYCLGPHALAWNLPGRVSLSPAHSNFGPDLPKPKGTCGPTMMKSLNVLVLPLLCTHAHPLLTSGTTNGDKAPDNRCGERRAITVAGRAHTDPVSTQPPLPLLTTWTEALNSAWGLPLPSPCLHSHLPVREPRPPHSSHSGRLLLTAQDRGQPGSSATSAGGRKLVTGGGLDSVSSQPLGAEGSTGWAPFMGEPRGVGVP